MLYFESKINNLILFIMKTNNLQVVGFPFVSNVDKENKPTLDISFLDRAYAPFFTNNSTLIQRGVYRLMGYEYDFTPYLKKYLYKQHGQWVEAFAPNKTKLRAVVYGRIDKIIELE